MSITKVAVAGATGNIGRSIIRALVDSKQFTVTALTRSSSKGTQAFASSVHAPIVDYDNIDSLISVLKGQDAVISALSSSSVAQQQVLLDATVKAGVLRYIPSEFGSDTLNEHAAKLPVFSSKKKMQKQIEDLAAQGKLTYTYVMNGPFLDLALDMGFLGLDIKQKHLSYLDGGDVKFSTTTRDTVGKVVAGVLSKPEETKNRAVFVEEAGLSLKDLLRLSKEALGEDGWTEHDNGSSSALEKSCYEKLGQGQKELSIFVGLLLCAVFKDGYGGRFQRLDNDLFKVSALKEEEIIEVIREVNQAKGL